MCRHSARARCWQQGAALLFGRRKARRLSSKSRQEHQSIESCPWTCADTCISRMTHQKATFQASIKATAKASDIRGRVHCKSGSVYLSGTPASGQRRRLSHGKPCALPCFSQGCAALACKAQFRAEQSNQSRGDKARQETWHMTERNTQSTSRKTLTRRNTQVKKWRTPMHQAVACGVGFFGNERGTLVPVRRSAKTLQLRARGQPHAHERLPQADVVLVHARARRLVAKGNCFKHTNLLSERVMTPCI